MQSIYHMANAMFESRGMAVEVFLRQRLSDFVKMRNAEEVETVHFIDEI